MKIIAHIQNEFKDKFGIPRQSGRARTVSRVVFEPEFRSPEALREIEGFSHLWLIFDFSKAHREGWSPTVRPPRLGGNRRVGVFASRSPFRPNPIGLSCVKLVGVERGTKEGDILVVESADLLDGTPIFDIKPYLPFADCHPEAVGGYAEAFVEHRLFVEDENGLLNRLPEADRIAVADCIEDDPRPSYQEDETRIYRMRYGAFDVAFSVKGEKAVIVEVNEVE